MHRQHITSGGHQRNLGKIPDRIEGDLRIDVRRDRVGRSGGEQQRVAVGRGFGHLFVPVRPPAPGRLSTTNCWPKLSENFWLAMRAIRSAVPPAAHDSTMGAVREGYFWANVAPETATNAAHTKEILGQRLDTATPKRQVRILPLRQHARCWCRTKMRAAAISAIIRAVHLGLAHHARHSVITQRPRGRGATPI